MKLEGLHHNFDSPDAYPLYSGDEAGSPGSILTWFEFPGAAAGRPGIRTLSPGFAVDEDPEHLGEALKLPAQHEHLREQLERVLTPVTNPRTARVA